MESGSSFDRLGAHNPKLPASGPFRGHPLPGRHARSDGSSRPVEPRGPSSEPWQIVPSGNSTSRTTGSRVHPSGGSRWRAGRRCRRLAAQVLLGATDNGASDALRLSERPFGPTEVAGDGDRNPTAARDGKAVPSGWVRPNGSGGFRSQQEGAPALRSEGVLASGLPDGQATRTSSEELAAGRPLPTKANSLASGRSSLSDRPRCPLQTRTGPLSLFVGVRASERLNAGGQFTVCGLGSAARRNNVHRPRGIHKLHSEG